LDQAVRNAVNAAVKAGMPDKTIVATIEGVKSRAATLKTKHQAN